MTETMRPRPAATRFGTVMLLGKTGNLAADIGIAIQAAGGPIFTVEDIERLLKRERITAGLRAEAGYRGTPLVSIFFTRTETLASGKMAHAFLTLMRTPPGDAVLWNVGIMDNDHDAIMCADRTMADTILALLRKAARGPSTDVNEYSVEIPGGDLEPC
jgi:hypothetical protein